MYRNLSFTNRFAARLPEDSVSTSNDPDAPDSDKPNPSSKEKSVERHSRVTIVTIGVLLKIVDIALFAGLGWTSFIFLSGYIFIPRVIGFHCHELPGLSAPFLDHTFSVRHLLYTVLVVPGFLFDLCEGAYLRRNPNIASSRLRLFFANSTTYFLRYFMGFVLQAIFMEAGKCGFGRLRPNFLSMCLPDWSLIGVDCNLTDNFDVYVADAHCTTDEWHQRTSRGSFPSGHASCAVYFVVACALYIHELWRCDRENAKVYDRKEAPWPWRDVLLTIFVSFYTIWAAVCCVTRVTDGWHHVTDVVAGVILGTMSAYVMFGRRTTQQAVRERAGKI